MSHFIVMVIGDEPENQLAPFDENLVLPRYIEYTREQAIEKSKTEVKMYAEGIYADYLADKKKYIKLHDNTNHIKYLSEKFPKKLNWTDEEHYQSVLDWYENDDIDDKGNLYSTFNPKAQWDWYQLGGRWSGLIKLREDATTDGIVGQSGVFGNEPGIDQALKGDIDNLNELKTFALLKHGKWHEKGSMGWWGTSSDNKDEGKWDKKIEELLADVSDDTLISIYDCHI